MRDGDHYVLNGQKTFITNGVNAGLAIVLASTAPDLGARGLSLFCVEAGLPGYAKGAPLDKIGQHSQDTCELFFDDLRLPADCLLGQENAAFEYPDARTGARAPGHRAARGRLAGRHAGGNR